jgi:hypothetical protein
MPSTSKKQHNFMAAIANSPSFAKKVGVPQSVGSDFSKADKGRKFLQGGDMATKGMKSGMHMMPDGKMMKNSAMKKSGMAKFSAGGFTKEADGVARKGKTKATQIKMKSGGGC